MERAVSGPVTVTAPTGTPGRLPPG